MESRGGEPNGASDARAAGEDSSAPSPEHPTALDNTTSSESAPRASTSRPSAPLVTAPPMDAPSPVGQGQPGTGAGKIACGWCGAMNPEGALRCGSCGYRFSVRCHTCGMSNAKDAANCSYCGESLRLAPFDTMEIARARAALRVRRLQTAAKGQSSGAHRHGPMPSSPKPLSRLFLLLLVTGGASLTLLIFIIVLLIMLNGGAY